MSARAGEPPSKAPKDLAAESTPPPDCRYFVRRLPNTTSRWRRNRRCYEVGTFTRDGSVPVAIEPTDRPETVLLHAGLHTTDIADYIRNADAVWQGGTGAWRGMWPDRDP